jgi:hypothetical protein
MFNVEGLLEPIIIATLIGGGTQLIFMKIVIHSFESNSH